MLCVSTGWIADWVSWMGVGVLQLLMVDDSSLEVVDDNVLR